MRLLQSKLSPPGVAAGCLHRDALIERLAAVEHTRAVLLEGPAGYGKTTVMEQMFADQRAADAPVAWLTLDAYDSDPAELIRYLAALFERSDLLAGEPPDAIGELQRDASPRAALDALLEAAARGSRAATFFLDDLHTVTNPDALSLIRMLLADSRPNLRLVVASRGRQRIDVSRLAIQGKLRVFTGRHVRFSRHEIAALLGPGCTPELLAVLDEKTHGWPVALQLLRTAMRHDESKLPMLAGRIADIPGVADYLTEQVMTHLTPEVQHFLMITSIPDSITGELANQLCDRTDGWSMLQTLEQRGLFIGRIGPEAHDYRYCEFFREFLRRRVMHEASLDLVALHRKTAQVLFAASQFEEALKHSIEAADWDLAIRIVEDEGSWQAGVRRGSVALQGLQTIPAVFIRRSLGARLGLIYVLLNHSQVDNAREQFEALRAESRDFSYWEGAAIEAALATGCRALDAILVLCEDKPLSVEFVERITREARAQGTRGQFVRVLAENSLAIYAHYAAGRYHDCSRLGEAALLGLQRIKADFGLGYLYIYLGMSQFALGRAQLAQSWYAKAFNLASLRFPNESQRLEALAGIAETDYHQGNLESAQKSIGAVLEGLKQQNEIDSSVCHGAYLTAAALHARAGNLDAALSALMEARAIARYMQREQRVAIIDIRRVDELTRAGHLPEAEKIILQQDFQRTLNEPVVHGSIPLLQMQAAIALARFELLTRNVEGARTRLVRLMRQAQAHDNELVKLKSLLLLAAAQFTAGELAESMQSLRSFCSRIIPTGLKQLVIEERQLIQPALDYLLETEPVGTAARANAEIIAADWLPEPDSKRGPPQQSPVATTHWLAAPGLLSPRQREVLELLAAGLSGKEIATQLSLAESTVKSYRKSLYAKLSAGRRSQALANARRMLLLSR